MPKPFMLCYCQPIKCFINSFRSRIKLLISASVSLSVTLLHPVHSDCKYTEINSIVQHQGQQKALKHCSIAKTFIDFSDILHADLARFQGGFDQVCTTEHRILFVIFNMAEEWVAQQNNFRNPRAKFCC